MLHTHTHTHIDFFPVHMVGNAAVYSSPSYFLATYMLFLRVCVCQASEEVSKCLVAMKEILYGTNDKEPHTETVAQLAQELYNSGLLISLVENLQVIDFEVNPTDLIRNKN